MEVRLERQPSVDGATLGAIYLGEHRLCYSLEDVVRDGPKIAHETAIPFGRFRITMYLSPRFGRMVPLLHDVPDFTMVEIHAGNVSTDTAGCILVGVTHTLAAVQQSQPAFQDLCARIASALAAGEDVWISIVRAPERTLAA